MPDGTFADPFAFRRASPYLLSSALMLLAGGNLPADETASAPPAAAAVDREQGDTNWSERLRRAAEAMEWSDERVRHEWRIQRRPGSDAARVLDPADRVIHTDLHYGNILAAEREPWLVIDPKPVNGDPHYEIAPMLWNRWDEIAGDVRDGVRKRLWTLVDAAGFDEDRARAWVIVRMVHNAMWSLQDGPQTDPAWLTRCIAVAKAVQD